MPVKLEYLRPGHCPVCDIVIPTPAIVNIALSNGTVMQQPVCSEHFAYMLLKKSQELLVRYCKVLWCKEILESEQLSQKDKNLEMKRIKALRVIDG